MCFVAKTMAFVQMPDLDAASRALHALNGKNLFEGCCEMKIMYSNIDEVEMNNAGSEGAYVVTVVVNCMVSVCVFFQLKTEVV